MSAQRGDGFLAIWSDIASDTLTDYLHWLTREHTEERVSTDGFLAVRVFRAVRPDLARFAILYELADATVLDGPAYLARLNAPTPWSQRIMPQLGNFVRGGGRMAARAGRGEGGVAAAVRLEAAPADPVGFAASLAAIDRVAAIQLGVTDAGRTAVRTNEKSLREKDESFGALALIEALDETALEEALAAAARLHAAEADAFRAAETLRAMFSLDRRNLGLS